MFQVNLLSSVLQLLKSWEYKNSGGGRMSKECVLQLLKSWEYKNFVKDRDSTAIVLQLLKSWEYKNSEIDTPLNFGFTVT